MIIAMIFSLSIVLDSKARIAHSLFDSVKRFLVKARRKTNAAVVAEPFLRLCFVFLLRALYLRNQPLHNIEQLLVHHLFRDAKGLRIDL